MAICAIIIKDSGKDYVKIGYVGSKYINDSSLKLGENLEVKKGDFVHISCRKHYINKKYIFLLLITENNSESQRNLCSSGIKCGIRNECIFCGNPDKFNKKKAGT